ncbi:MAG TPA: hypothetical protein VLI04_04110 [Nocardioidaceae bacterium]|nr:hypothetical protein [Nocardioidaceae bacterium]
MIEEGARRGRVSKAAAFAALGLTSMALAALPSRPGPAQAEPIVARSPTLVLAAGTSATSRAKVPAELPFGKGPIYPGRILVAYYGTAGTGALGVLGEDDPDAITRRLRRAAAPFATEDRPVQIVYELIVTVADAGPGDDGDYSHDIAREKVETYIKAAHRNKALLVLDLQTGRSDFLTVAKRWKWALRDPWVGLALDPEWRMGPREVPAQVIGSVGAREVNRVSEWLVGVSRRNDLPQKIFMLHSFRTSMIENISDVVRRPRLATVLHIDGFGTPGQKLATFHTVADTRPRHMRMGFKLFYDEDIALMSPSRVREIRPLVEFVSYQ